MKRGVAVLIIVLLLSSVAFAQEDEGFFWALYHKIFGKKIVPPKQPEPRNLTYDEFRNESGPPRNMTYINETWVEVPPPAPKEKPKVTPVEDKTCKTVDCRDGPTDSQQEYDVDIDETGALQRSKPSEPKKEEPGFFSSLWEAIADWRSEEKESVTPDEKTGGQSSDRGSGKGINYCSPNFDDEQACERECAFQCDRAKESGCWWCITKGLPPQKGEYVPPRDEDVPTNVEQPKLPPGEVFRPEPAGVPTICEKKGFISDCDCPGQECTPKQVREGTGPLVTCYKCNPKGYNAACSSYTNAADTEAACEKTCKAPRECYGTPLGELVSKDTGKLLDKAIAKKVCYECKGEGEDEPEEETPGPTDGETKTGGGITDGGTGTTDSPTDGGTPLPPQKQTDCSKWGSNMFNGGPYFPSESSCKCPEGYYCWLQKSFGTVGGCWTCLQQGEHAGQDTFACDKFFPGWQNANDCNQACKGKPGSYCKGEYMSKIPGWEKLSDKDKKQFESSFYRCYKCVPRTELPCENSGQSGLTSSQALCQQNCYAPGKCVATATYPKCWKCQGGTPTDGGTKGKVTCDKIKAKVPLFGTAGECQKACRPGVCKGANVDVKELGVKLVCYACVPEAPTETHATIPQDFPTTVSPTKPAAVTEQQCVCPEGSSPSQPDPNQILASLNQYRCVSGASINVKGTRQGNCPPCYGQAQINVNSQPPVCQTPCGPVACDSSASCPCPDKPNCQLTASCKWGGWKYAGNQQYVPVVG